MMMLVASLRDGGGPRWAVRSKESGLYIAKRECVTKCSFYDKTNIVILTCTSD